MSDAAATTSGPTDPAPTRAGRIARAVMDLVRGRPEEEAVKDVENLMRKVLVGLGPR